MRVKILLLFVFFTVSTVNIYAAIHTVTNGDNAGAGSLRNTVAIANSGDTVVFDNVDTVFLTVSLLVNKNLTIIGEKILFMRSKSCY